MSYSNKKNILLGITGSIAAYKAAALASSLVQDGHTVQAVCTESALQFIGKATLEGLTGRTVKTSVFSEQGMMDHIDLARWADVYLIAPCSANTLAQLALGMASDLVSTLALAFDKPESLFIAPAMNTKMWEHPAVQENLHKLSSYNYQIISPVSGRLACGEEGLGKMADPEDIKQIILSPSIALSESKEKVLITFGGTREAIDGVRAITNTSTGETGLSLTERFLWAGHSVHALASTTNRQKTEDLLSKYPQFTVEHFESHADLSQLLKNALSTNSYAHVVHLAAVSDFAVDSIEFDGRSIRPSSEFKIGSTHTMNIRLKKTHKLIDAIHSWAQTKPKSLIAFKLTNNASRAEQDAAVKHLFASVQVDYVVHNDLKQFSENRKLHHFTVFERDNQRHDCQGAAELAEHLLLLFKRPNIKKHETPLVFEVQNGPLS